MQHIRYVLFDFFGTLVDYVSGPASLHEMYAPLAGVLPDHNLALLDEAGNAAFSNLPSNAVRAHDDARRIMLTGASQEELAALPKEYQWW